MFQGDVTDSRYVEETSEGVGTLGGKDVEQGHPAVEAGQGALTAKQLPEAKQ